MKKYMVDARGKQCPIPVVETKKMLAQMAESDIVETLVDNAIAVQNLEKMAKQKQLECSWEQQDEHTYRVFIKAEGAVDEAGKRLQNVSRVSRSPKKQEIQSLCYLLTAWERGMKFLERH